MIRRSTRARASALTSNELMNAIEPYSTDDGSTDMSDEEEVIDCVTDSEEDGSYEPNSDIDDVIEEEEEVVERIVINPTSVYTSRDGTEWQSKPVNIAPNRFRNLPIQPKVVLPGGKRLDTAMDCFRLFFDDHV